MANSSSVSESSLIILYYTRVWLTLFESLVIA
jgi:hypothetical protein